MRSNATVQAILVIVNFVLQAKNKTSVPGKSEKSNLRDLSKDQPQTDTTVQQRMTRSRTKELLAARDRSTTEPTVRSPQNDNEESSNNETPSEYVIDRIVSHGINDDTDHPSADVGETTYRIRWYGYSAKDDTYEPIRHLPRNKVVSYYKRKKLPVPNNIEEAQQGWLTYDNV